MSGSKGPMEGSGEKSAGGSAEGQRESRVSDLRVRFLSAIVLAPVVLGLVWYGGWAFAVLAALAAAILVSEWSGVSRGSYTDAAVFVGGSGAALAVLAFAGGYFAIAGGLLVAAALIGQVLARHTDTNRLFAVGIFYGGLPAVALVMLRGDPQFGLAAIVWVLIIVWASDIGAYLCGRMIGGPKIAPRISPKKTWSGAIGGVLSAVVGSALFVHLSAIGGLVPVAVLAALLSAVSQVGDFFESGFKRRFGVKDSSHLIPGHGGLMDRVDALVAAAFVAGLIGVARGGPGAAGAGLLLW